MISLRNLFLSVVLLFVGMNAHAAHLFSLIGGGALDETFFGVAPTSDGGFIATGRTESFGAGSADVWVMKFDDTGSINWQKAYGTAAVETGFSIAQTADGGYIVGAYTDSNAGDFLVLKLASDGSLEWQKTYGGSSSDIISSISQTTDGGFIVGGRSQSFSATLDGWVIKLTSFGVVQWQKVYGGANQDAIDSVEQTPDGGYIASGVAQSSGSSDPDVWVMKLDASGNVTWQKVYGTASSDDERALSVHRAADGGYTLAGRAEIGGQNRFYVMKIDSAGNVQWQKYYGLTYERVFSSAATSDGGLIVTGETASFGAGAADGWIVKLDSTGAMEWQKTYGGTGIEALFGIAQVTDGGFVAVGLTDSPPTAGVNDALVLRISPDGEIDQDCPMVADSFGSAGNAALALRSFSSTTGNSIAAITDTALAPTNTVADVSLACSQFTCIYCDDFEDGILDPNWNYVKPSWSESGGNLVANATKKALAVASPVFGGCSDCQFEASITSDGSPGNKISLLGWYTDKGNNVEVLMKQPSGKFVMKQRIGGSIVAKTKALMALSPNVAYDVRVMYDGTALNLLVNGNVIGTVAAPAPPAGTIALQAAKTTARFSHVLVD